MQQMPFKRQREPDTIKGKKLHERPPELRWDHTVTERPFQQYFPTCPLADMPQELEAITSRETFTLYLEGHSNFSAHGFNGIKRGLSPVTPQVVACLGAEAV